MSETSGEPRSGAVRIIAAFLWAVAAAALGYGLWRTIALARPIEEAVLLFSMTAICAGLGTAFYALATSKQKD
jgi:hypothetical protein